MTDYPPKGMTLMAHAVLEERWEEFIAKAKASSVVEEVRQKRERRERSKAAKMMKSKASSVEASGPPPS